MKITCNWLGEYVEFDWDWRELVERLTKSGLELEGAVDFEERYAGVVVGRVLECDEHPNADRLSVCRVDIGAASPSTIVCGAPNVAAAQLVAVITPGHTLPDGVGAIVRTKIRGVESAGMICSETELGLGDDGSGIIVLPEAYTVGASFAVEAGLADVAIDFEVTPNRPDCLSVLGIAREVSALNGSALTAPLATGADEGSPTSVDTSIDIADPAGCPRYVGRLIRGVSVGPSPPWLSNRLLAVGVRPINNIVDATNYVMMELGQPLHAFDYAKLEESRIVVRRARAAEKLETLDGATHDLSEETLVIADGQRPVALAGIMGGANSEVSSATTDILLESAYFDPTVVRASAARFGIQTEASMRFERGADWSMPPMASERAARLIADIATGHVAPDPIDAFPTPFERRTIPLRLPRLHSLLGAPIEAQEVHRILTSLGCERVDDPEVVSAGRGASEGRSTAAGVARAIPKDTAPAVSSATSKNNASASYSVPSFRPDLSREVDLIEEVGRIYGYDRIEASQLIRGPSRQPDFGGIEAQRHFKHRLADLGLDEVVTNSIVERSWFDSDSLELENPPTEGQSILRRSLIPSLADIARLNINQRAGTVAIFELGKCFSPAPGGGAAEASALTGLWTGMRSASTWRQEQRPFDFSDLKGLLEIFLEDVNPQFEPAAGPFFRRGCCAAITAAEVQLGLCGEASSDLASSFDLQLHPVYIFELNVDGLERAWTRRARDFHPLPKFPPVERDLAVLVSQSVRAGQIIDEIRSAESELIEAIELFDVYEGDAIEAGCKSLAFSIRLRSPEGTLTDAQADDVMTGLISRLGRIFGAKLREG